MDNEDEIIEESNSPDTQCPRCGFRTYDDVCQSCGSPIISKIDDEEEDYDWREKKR